MDEGNNGNRRNKRRLQRQDNRSTNLSNEHVANTAPRPQGVNDKMLEHSGYPEAFETVVAQGSTKLTVGQVVAELVKYNGHLSFAARALNITQRMLSRFIEQHPSISTSLKDIQNSLLDLAESQLYRKVTEGDLQAIKFVLKCRGRERGWIELQEHQVVHQIPQFKYMFQKGSAIPQGPGRPPLPDPNIIDAQVEEIAHIEGKSGDENGEKDPSTD